VSEHAGRSTLDVLVPTRNRPAELAVTLAGLAGQDHPFNPLVSDLSRWSRSPPDCGRVHPSSVATVVEIITPSKARECSVTSVSRSGERRVMGGTGPAAAR
jgi:hypothetical protein